MLVSVALAVYSARSIRFRFQFRDFYDYPANPQLALFKQENREFGDPAGYVVALLHCDRVFRPEVLAYVRELTRALEPDKTFVRVRSLSNVHVVRGQGDDVVSGPLFSEVPRSPDTLRELEQFAVQSPLLSRRLISKDAKTTAVLAEMRTPVAFATIAEERQAIAAVRAVVQRLPAPPGVKLSVTGSPAVEVGVTDALTRDQLVLMPAVLLVLVSMLFVTFRSFHGILLCLAAVGVATIWTAGLFALAHRPVDIIGSVIPTTILVYGVVDPIFVLTRVLNKVEAGWHKEEAIVKAFAELAVPCFLTSLTTALGFAVFVTVGALTVRYYGMTVAAGVLLSWVTSVTVLPVLLGLAPLPKRRFSAVGSTRHVDRALGGVWDFLRVRLTLAAALTGLCLVGGAWLARVQHVDNVYVDTLPRGAAHEDLRSLERDLSGVIRVIVHLEGAPDSMQRPEVLKAIEQVDLAISKHKLVTLSSSLADLVAEANQAFQGGDPEARRVPRSASLIAQYLALIDPGDRSDFVTDDFSRTHIDILVQDSGSEATRALVSQLRALVHKAHFEALGIKVGLTGNGVVAYDEVDRVVRDLLYGFVGAFAAIVALEWLVLRSLRVALISVIPNLLPVVACFLTLRVLNIHLRIDTALVLCISIGGLFNTTIHFAARLQQRVRDVREDPDLSILQVMRAVGPASLFTAVTLSAGFAVLLLSSFPGLRSLGLLSMVTLLTGFVSDMVVTPVLLRDGFAWPKLAARGRLRHAGAGISDIRPGFEYSTGRRDRF